MTIGIEQKAVSVKATPVNVFVDFVTRELTAEQLERALLSLPAEDRTYFTGRLFAHTTVPLPALNAFTRAAAMQKGEPLRDFARRAGNFGAEAGLKTVYKYLLMVVSIEGVLKKAPLMWTRVYDAGALQVVSEGTTARIYVRDFPADEGGCGRITGWFELIGLKTRAKNIRTREEKCRTRGASECVWLFEWDA